MDTVVVILLIILVIMLGIFVLSSLSGDPAGRVTGNQYPSQYGGGGCGR